MISFSCQQCSRQYKVDNKYAGKKARCKQCNTYNVIPMPRSAPGKPAAPQAISFSCDMCGQQLKVKSIHAGKRVKCTSCEEPCLIPNQQAAEKSADAAEMVTFECQMCSAQMQAAKSKAGDIIECPKCQSFVEVPGKPEPQEEMTFKDWEDQEPEEEFLPIGPGPSIKPITELESTLPATMKIPDQFKMPAAIAASFTLGMIGVAIWTLLAVAIGFQLAIMIIPVCILASIGVTLFFEQREALHGLLAIAVALIAVFIGKALVVKFVGIPAGRHDASVMDERLREFMVLDSTSQSVICIASCMELRDEGKIPPELIWYVLDEFISGNPVKTPTGITTKNYEIVFRAVLKSLDHDVLEERKEDIDAGLQAAKEYMSNLTSQKKVEVFKAHREEIKQECSISAAFARMSFAKIFIGYIGLLDLVCLALGLIAAFNLGAGRNASFN